MTTATYQAAICGMEGNYGVVFPDFPGCGSAGDTIEHVTAMAHEALSLHVAGMVEDGDPLPQPTYHVIEQFGDLFNDPDDSIDETWVTMIDVTVEVPERVPTMQLRVKADLVQRIADLAEMTSLKIDSRRFIEEAVEHEIERYRRSAA